MKDYQFEVCANSVESCIAAQAGGADRVELCAGIPEGGTTPSYGDILIAREALQQTKLHIIVRPRGGDFLYSSTEQRIMLKDIENARRLNQHSPHCPRNRYPRVSFLRQGKYRKLHALSQFRRLYGRNGTY